MSYKIEKDFVRFDHHEGARYDQIVNDLENLVKDPGLVERLNFLVDLTRLPKPLEAEDMRQLSLYLEDLTDRVGPKFVFIVLSPVVYGMIRLLGAHLSSRGFEVQIFDNEDDAVRWLKG